MRLARRLAVTLLAAAPAAEARNFTWAFAGDMLTLDPHASSNTLNNASLGNVHEALLRHDERIEIGPALAVSWTRPSPAVWRFRLREGVRFHNGETSGAEDVGFSWARLGTPGALARGNMANLREVRAVGPHEVEIETHRPCPTAPDNRLRLWLVRVN
jgi:peptide/nickel transport system substrate-binding protein